jgi:hypothetical protein
MKAFRQSGWVRGLCLRARRRGNSGSRITSRLVMRKIGPLLNRTGLTMEFVGIVVMRMLGVCFSRYETDFGLLSYFDGLAFMVGRYDDVKRF